MAITKKSTVTTVDIWTSVAAATAYEGAAGDVSDAYSATFIVQTVPLEEASVFDAYTFDVEISYVDDDDWSWYKTLTTPDAISPNEVDDLNGAVTANDTTITVTLDALVVGEYYLLRGIGGDTTAASEIIYVISDDGANVYGLSAPLKNSHEDASTIWSDVTAWTIKVPDAASQIRVLPHNADPTYAMLFASQILKVTAV